MDNLHIIEESYKSFTKNLTFWLPEGLSSIDLKLLYDLDLLHFQPLEAQKQFKLQSLFHIIESLEKITLVNQEFIVWIIPSFSEEQSTTVLIALNRGEEKPRIEIGFMGTGIYNQSKLILQVLEKFLIEIQETEHLLERVLEQFKNI